MIDKIPFGLYDFFGYLASGLLIVVGMELVFGFPPILGRDLTVIETAILILGVYVAGQLVATPAKLVLEDGLVGKVLKRPSVNLFQEKRPRIGRLLAPGYYQELPEQRRKKILDRAGKEGVTGTGEDLFLHVRYSTDIREDQAIMDRLNKFLASYGFARNLGFTSLVVGTAILVKPLFVENPDPEQVKYGIVALIAGVLLVYRYLKFFRQYAYEMFNAYAKGGQVGEFKVYFLPVGQGDSTYVELPNGQKMLVDINRHPGHGIDVIRFLKDRIPEAEDEDGNRVRKLDYLAITHAHEDHIKGLKELDEEFVFGEIWDSGHEYEYGEDLWKEYREILQRYYKKGLVRYRKASSEPFFIGTGEDQVTFYVLSPSGYVRTTERETEKEKREAVHEESLVLKMLFRNTGVLVTGDSNKACWERINKYFGDVLRSKVLHTSHHGSRTFFKTGEDDEEPLEGHLTKIDPEYLVVSVSHPSKHGHPHEDAMKLYWQAVDKKNVRYTETSQGLEAHVFRVYKNEEEGKWYYGFATDTELVSAYFLEQDKKYFTAPRTPSYEVRIGARVGDQEWPLHREVHEQRPTAREGVAHTVSRRELQCARTV